ncbi:MAG: ABC transporter ATP-binding protein [Bacilli bacterium]|nr:ABC transporter ATP-binding protein [Bacilli bacterium]
MNSKQRLLSYLRPEKKRMIFIAISVLLFILSQLSTPFLVGSALDAVGGLNEAGQFIVNVDVFKVTLYLILCTVLSFSGAIFAFLFEYQVGLLTQNIIYRLRNDIYKKIHAISVGTLYEKSSGNVLQLEIQDVENVANGLFSVFKQFIQGVLTLLVTLVMMFVVNYLLAILAILLSPISILISRFVAKGTHKYFKSQASLQANLSSLSKEAISNSDLLQSLNGKEDALKRYQEKNEELQQQARVAQFYASLPNPTTRLANNTIYAIIGIVGIIMIGFTPTYPFLMMSIGKLSSFLSYTSQFTKPFNDITSVLSEFETAKYSFQRIHEFFLEEEDIDEGKEKIDGEMKEIRFEHLDFSYTKEQKLIEDFSITIHRGDKVAIVGPTGAGKSTLINLLMRFYDPVKGRITFNGIDTRDISKHDLRENFGMVLQETWIFSGTILENVRYAKPSASDEEVKEACKRAHADTFIQTLPDGYDTLVSSKEGLSEGERQMLTIARVMLLDPDIVILDEATSNVDTRTEKLITDAFDTIMKGKTSIVIAHRLSTIKQADIILVLKDGHIIETGNHLSLMKEKGFYYSMYSSQFEGSAQ